MRVQLRRDEREIGARMGNPRIPRIPRIPGFPGFLVIPALTVSCKLLSASFHLWSILRGNGAHTPIQDLESYESILSMSLTLGAGPHTPELGLSAPKTSS